jgi:hypothetical protein
MLQKRQIQRYGSLVTCTFSLGCASFHPSLDQKQLFGGSRIPSVTQAREGITVSIEEFASPSKSKEAFDDDVLSSGVLPLLLRVDSRSESTFKLASSSIKAYLDNQLLDALSGETAARQAATRDYVGKALGWTLLTGPFAIIAWPGTIVGSSMHTRHINSRIIQHFQSLEFKGAVIRPNQPVSGFLYYQIPQDGKTLQVLAEKKTLQNLKVELVAAADQGGDDVSFAVQIPNVDLSTSARK